MSASIFGGIGKLEIAPVNSPNDPFPYYVDISTFWRAENTALSITRGRQTELDAIQPSQLTAVLDNTDNRFTNPITTKIMSDSYHRTVANGWGNADTGQAWTVSGTASNWSVGGSSASLVTGTGTGDRFASMNLGQFNGEMDVVFGATIPASGLSRQGPMVRFDGSNYYAAHAMIDVNANVTLVIRSVSAGTVVTDLISVPIGITTASGNPLFIKFNCFGPVLRAKLWDLTQQSEPTSWVTVNDYQPINGTQVGCYHRNDDSGSLTFPTYASSFEQQSVLPYGLVAGQPIRYSETIGDRTFTLFTGFVQFPDVDDWKPIGYQEVQLTATDLLTRLGRTAPFLSTLSAHILGSPTAANLVAYYPLNSAALLPVVGPPSAILAPQLSITESAIYNIPALVNTASDGVPGDDMTGVVFTPQPPGAGVSVAMAPLVGTINLNASSSQTVVLSAWIKNTFAADEGLPVFIGDSGGSSQMVIFNDAAGASASVRINGTDTVIATTPIYPVGTWRLVTISLNYGTGAATMWCGSDIVATGTAAGAPHAAIFNEVELGVGWWAGEVAHVQVYIGIGTPFSRSDHLAQWQVGQLGLEYQTTGQRVTSILNYAGIPAGLRTVDLGESFMSKATLSGQSAAQALQDAIDTERARAFMSGDGHYVFQDRQHTLNV